MIGILGGMGTQAGLDFCNKLAILYRGKIDQEYPLFILYNKSNIPGRPENLNKYNLSNDASEILKISLLTNAYYPNQNITEEEFLKFKSDWMIKDSDYEIIEKYLLKNQLVNLHPELTRYLVDSYLSKSNVKKSCEIFSKIEEAILSALEMTPPELSADIYKTGIYLAGGSSMLRGLDKRISQKTKLPVHIAEDPLRAVARGTGIALKNIDKFQFLIKA